MNEVYMLYPIITPLLGVGCYILSRIFKIVMLKYAAFILSCLTGLGIYMSYMHNSGIIKYY